MTMPGRTRGRRVYERRFDHDEAILRYAQGESINALASEFGVTQQAVRRLVSGDRVRELEAGRRWRTGECETCGGPAMRLVAGKLEHNPDGRTLCVKCRGVERRERLRFNEQGELVEVRCSSLDCANGDRWQPADQFPAGIRFKDVRANGIAGSCRACQTRGRRLYREAHKVPCDRCGAPRLPQSEKNGGSRSERVRDTGLCIRCYRDDIAKRTHFGGAA